MVGGFVWESGLLTIIWIVILNVILRLLFLYYYLVVVIVLFERLCT